MPLDLPEASSARLDGDADPHAGERDGLPGRHLARCSQLGNGLGHEHGQIERLTRCDPLQKRLSSVVHDHDDVAGPLLVGQRQRERDRLERACWQHPDLR